MVLSRALRPRRAAAVYAAQTIPLSTDNGSRRSETRAPKSVKRPSGKRNPRGIALASRSPKDQKGQGELLAELSRCRWATMYTGAGSADYVEYHDKEWGRPIRGDDNRLFEFLVLEGAQAGLSWATILKKRAAYRKAFADFDVATVAKFTSDDIDKLLEPTSGIVRHRGKISSAVENAKLVEEIASQYGSFSDYMWTSFVPNGKPIVNSWKRLEDVPTKTPEAEHMSRELKKRGFKFVGPTICYSFMQAVGMVNDHLIDCYCRSICLEDSDRQH